jgi:hypothetical protein
MLAPIVLLADYSGTLQVADLTEVRARTTDQSGASAPAGTTTTTAVPAAKTQGSYFSLDVFTQPQLHLHVKSRVWDYDLEYRPSMTLPDLETGTFCSVKPVTTSLQPTCSQPSVLHIGSAGVSWHDRRVRLSVTENASYGQFNSAYLQTPSVPTTPTTPGAPPTAPPGQLAPAPQTITYLGTTTALAVDARLDRRTMLDLRTEYTARGGFNAASRAVLPEVYGPRTDAKVVYALGPHDEAVTAAYVTALSFSPQPCYDASSGLPTGNTCTPRDQIAQATEIIRHALARATTVTAGGGLAVARVSADRGAPYDVNVFPVAQAGITQGFGWRGLSTLSAEVGIAPLVDVLTGHTSERLYGDAALAEAFSRSLSVSLSVAAAQTVPPSAPLAATYVRGGLDLVCKVTRSLELSLGERGAWQKEVPFGTFFSTYGYFDVTVRAPELRF